MHPRNIYKIPPDFKQLAIEYAEFRKHAVQDLTGKVNINFRDPSALRALTQTLLKKDFDLEVEIPADRLIPTVPQRLNYILWIEDIVNENWNDGSVRRGIDIGTGASCVFPLLGSRKNGWNFLATETDQASYDCAVRNVENNKLEEKVKVALVSTSSSLESCLNDCVYDFCMCNPPFFCDNFDASWELKARKKNRQEPKGANTGSPVEIVTAGGEVEFVKNIIAESLILKERIRFYSSMLGKKSSVATIKEYLKEMDIPHFVTTEFQQGKTLRWGVAWTFCSDVKLKKIAFPKVQKPVKPLSFFIPSTLKCVDYAVLSVLGLLKKLINELDILYHVYEENETRAKLWIRSNTNTWSNQRRKKRELMRQKTQMGQPSAEESELKQENVLLTEANEKVEIVHEESIGNCSTANRQSNDKGSKRKHGDSDLEASDVTQSTELNCAESRNKILDMKSSNEDNLVWLLFADVHITLAGRCIVLELKARKQMESRETLHQIMQFFKNRLV